MKRGLKTAIFYVALIGVILIATAALWNSIPREGLSYSDVIK